MEEFDFIDLLADALGAARGAMEGVGDDGVILNIPEDRQLVVSTDSLVEGVHFEAGTAPGDLGYKALAVNLSDLAAMGAEPAWYLLALTLPSMQPEWAKAFAGGMNELARKAGVKLAGGDVTSGPLNVTVMVCGLVSPGKALTRSGAQVGDIVGLSGATGLAGRALMELKHGRTPAPACMKALRRPEPLLALGLALGGLANSCIDLSDGLLADLGHVAQASGVGAKLDLASLPVPAELADLPDKQRWDLQLGAGDDYELCFTAPPGRWDEIREKARAAGADAIAIGEVVEGQGCICVTPDGGRYSPRSAGYVHGVHT